MSKNKVKKVVREYENALRAKSFPIQDIFLFGSYAKETNRKDSDIDIAVVVDKIENGETYLEMSMEISRVASMVNSKIEPVLLEKDELKEQSLTQIADQVLKYGYSLI